MLTGGTTGAPKGVVWDHAGVCGVVSSAYRRAGVPVPADRAEVVAAAEVAVRGGSAPVMLPASPLMHGTGFFFSIGNLLRGGCVVTLPQRSLDPEALWTAVQEHRVVELGIVGDAFAVPLLAELDRAAADGSPYDLSTLRRVVSSGVRWSTENKRRLLRAGRFTVQDTIASTEGGPYGVALGGRTRTSCRRSSHCRRTPGCWRRTGRTWSRGRGRSASWPAPAPCRSVT
ncbi:AMP-binding protein [Blastococcus brunescens]|uniref:AMP-binding protein n=1 Tax=Blastococcus brunescens TaxID=1564165 RepID=A0ABZ1AZJ4_9ACTN|nr:AMP-binding protein [Blastococcus sp. BMG 8361]WRL62858.1 AMP-binding protein [Blastococcus sp. BMG 8361]